MTLIDKNALLNKAYYMGTHPTQDNPYGCGEDVVSAFDIENAPEIDAQPVVHSEWIPYGRDSAHTKFYRCSNCKYEIPIYEDSEDKPYKYCPECGAKMDI